jgi:hypothetical protein
MLQEGCKLGNIAVIITDLFEDSAYTERAAAIKKADHELINLGLEEGKT